MVGNLFHSILKSLSITNNQWLYPDKIVNQDNHKQQCPKFPTGFPTGAVMITMIIAIPNRIPVA